ncbi:MAG: hypothetical protein II846_02315 [Acetobacter sp.]|nr:hypothetical protein [Acetobacter sp.]
MKRVKLKLKQLKDLMLRFGNSRQQFFFSQKRGSIAIEGAVCTLVVFIFLGGLINLMEILNQRLLSIRLTNDLAISLFNGRNTNQAFLQGLVNQVMAANGVKGSSATVNTMYVNGSGALRTFNYGAGCSGPKSSIANGAFLEVLKSQFGDFSQAGGALERTVNSLAQVTVCVPAPFYLNWAMLGYTPPTSIAAVTMIGIPNPPKHK